MIPVAASVRIWIASGHTDMRKGMNGLALPVQEGLGRDQTDGALGFAISLFPLVFSINRFFGPKSSWLNHSSLGDPNIPGQSLLDTATRC
jgi:hypothetical protein